MVQPLTVIFALTATHCKFTKEARGCAVLATRITRGLFRYVPGFDHVESDAMHASTAPLDMSTLLAVAALACPSVTAHLSQPQLLKNKLREDTQCMLRMYARPRKTHEI